MQACKNYLDFLSIKSKVRWIQEGDDNTSLFHQSLRTRRLQNTVYSIRRIDVKWVYTAAFHGLYMELLGIKVQNNKKVLHQVVSIGPTFLKEKSQELLKPFSCSDVKNALFSIPGEKPPGPDG